MPDLEIGKTYPLADGSGTGTVVKVRYLVKINRPKRPNHGAVGTYTPDGKYDGALMFQTPDLAVGGAPQLIEEDAF